MITCQPEPWSRALPELKEYFAEHYAELALDQDEIKLDINYELLAQAEQEGKLLLVTARDGEKLVGYILVGLVEHTHYKSAGRMALVDAYYVDPQYRSGVGARMLLAMEGEARLRGARKIYLSCKVKQDHSVLFNALGYRLSDFMFTRLI